MAVQDTLLVVFKGEDESLGRTANSLGKPFNQLGKAVAGAAAIGGAALVGLGAGAVAVGSQLVSLGSDAEEMLGKFNVVFANTGGQVTDQLSAFADEVGRSKFELMGMASTFGDTLKPMGFTEEAAASMSVELTQLATDLGSFNNMPMDEALRRLQGTLIGSHENALAFGVIINENTLSAKLAEMGLDDLTGAAAEQAKVQARLALLMEGTTDAQGDAARTSGSWANQMRALKANLTDTATELGLRLLPVVTPLLSMFGQMAEQAVPFLTAAFDQLLPFIENVSFFIRDLVFHLQSGMSFTEALTTAFNDFAHNLGLTSEQSNAVSEAFSGFIEKVIEVKDQIIEFITPIVEWIGQFVTAKDVLIALGIVLGGVVLSALVSLASAIAPVLIAGAALIALVTAIRVAWETDFLGIRSFIEEIAPQIQEIIMNFVTWAQEFWAAHGEQITAIVSTMWTAVKEFFMTNLEAIMEIVRAFVALFQGDWEGFLEHMGNSLRLQIEAIILLFARIGLAVIPHIQAFGEMAIAKFKEIGTAIVDGLSEAIRSGASQIADAAKEAALSAWEAAKEALGISSPSRLFADIGTNVMQGFAAGIVQNQQALAGLMASTMQNQVVGSAQAALAGATNNNVSSTQIFNYNVQTSGFDVESQTRAAQSMQGGI